MAKKTISIFGCTGSVGTTTLDIIRENKEQFEVKVLTANKNIDDLLLDRRKRFKAIGQFNEI